MEFIREELRFVRVKTEELGFMRVHVRDDEHEALLTDLERPCEHLVWRSMKRGLVNCE